MPTFFGRMLPSSPMNPFWLLDTCSFAVGIGCNRGILALDTMAFEPASRTYHCFKCRGEFTPTHRYLQGVSELR